ncbi:hypothetical protein V2J09_012851 [Rumex salicifolius]
MADCAPNTARELACRDGSAAAHLKLIAIAVIFFTSVIGVFAPVFLARFFHGKPLYDEATLLIKCFAAGVILSISLVHVMPDAFASPHSIPGRTTPSQASSLSSAPCLRSSSTSPPPPTPSSTDTAEECRQSQRSPPWDEGEAKKVVMGLGVNDEGKSDGVACEDADAAATAVDIAGETEEELPAKMKQKMVSQVLEIGIIFHSVIIGVSMGMSQNKCTIRPLVAALAFTKSLKAWALVAVLLSSTGSSLHLPSSSSVAGACVLLLLPAVLVRPPPPSCSAGLQLKVGFLVNVSITGTMATLNDSFLADLDDLSDNEAEISEKGDGGAANMEEDGNDDMEDLEALNYDDLDSVSKLQKTQQDDPEYQLIVDCNTLSVDIENEITIIHNFIRDKYRLKFPELESLVHHPIDYARVVKKIGNETDLTLVDLEGLLPSAIIMVISVTASSTSEKTIEACDRALTLDSAKKKVLDFVESRMVYIAPNLSAIVGSAVAAKLMGTAGGLFSLAKMPACNVQLLGAKKNLAGFSFTTIAYMCFMFAVTTPLGIILGMAVFAVTGYDDNSMNALILEGLLGSLSSVKILKATDIKAKSASIIETKDDLPYCLGAKYASSPLDNLSN